MLHDYVRAEAQEEDEAYEQRQNHNEIQQNFE